jgi:Tol biopolymer transport system component
MALEAGSRVGGYEIVASLGEGGMSEVYRARDLTLGREVALKLLPDHWGDDPERVARFEREAQLLAALNHPNIAVIHRLERESSRMFLVLELVSGETLAERLTRGPLELMEALGVFLQVALALEAAHGKGIIHRDLKPGNVKITVSGVVKLLDFGLGKDLGPSTSTTGGDKTKTYVGPRSGHGLVVGTPAYMSPEQARGRLLGKGTDIWSFGVTLFEALSGRNPFERETIPDTTSAILNDEPPWHLLPPLPRGVDALLRRSLRKNEGPRLHDIADARIEIEDALAGDPPMTESGGARWRSPGKRVGALLLALGVAIGWGSFVALSQRRASSGTREPGIRRFTIELPATAPLSLENGDALAVSPDASRLVYAARIGDRRQIFVRPLSDREAVPIHGTEGGESPFFSPSGDWLGFYAGGKLKKLSTLSLAGGNPTPLADAASPRGSSWVERGGAGTILWSVSSARYLQSVSGSGGPPAPLAGVEQPGLRDLRWPAALPGGRSVLVTLWGARGFDVGILNLASGETNVALENGSYPRYVESGHVVFVRDGDLYAVTFDPARGRVLGEPAVVVEGVAADIRTGAAFYAVAADGTLFYLPAEGLDLGTAPGRAVALLVDRHGRGRPLVEPRPSLQVPRFSPDGGLLLMTAVEGETSDLWVFDRVRGTESRLTLRGNNGSGVFAPDGRRVAFASDVDGAFSIYWTLVDGSAPPERLTRAEHPQFPTSFSPDGRYLAYVELDPITGFDVYVLSLEGVRAARAVLKTRYEEAGAVFSPDGRFLAYTSDESGTKQVYVRRFPGPEGRWQISTGSGVEPVWSRDGRELYFRSGDSLMVSTIETDPDFRAGKPSPLFEAPFDSAGSLYADYDASPDGESFVMIRSEKERTATRILVIEGFLRELRERVPARN